jgi:FK506-binding protein 3
MTISPPWTSEEMMSDVVSKKLMVTFLHEHASNELLLAFKLNGTLANVVKSCKKPQLIDAYNQLFETQQFRGADEVAPNLVKSTPSTEQPKQEQPTTAAPVETVITFSKALVTKGDGVNRPKKGDQVAIFYTGTLQSTGKVFDSNTATKKKKKEPLKFKVGSGRAIRGLEDGVMSMFKGEKCKLTIPGEFAYGRKGLIEAGIGPNETLVFDVELVEVD